MPTVASDVMERAAAHLNDPNQGLYTNTVLLPYIQQALDDLQDAMIDNSIGVLREVSAAKDITAETTDMSSTLPTDVVVPVRMHERADGGDDDDWISMVKGVLPIREMGPILVHWEWRESMVYFVGATVAREVRLTYRRLFSPISGASSSIEMPTAMSFLACKTAEHAAGLAGANPTRSRILKDMAAKALDSLVRREVRNMTGVRRRRFVPGMK